VVIGIDWRRDQIVCTETAGRSRSTLMMRGNLFVSRSRLSNGNSASPRGKGDRSRRLTAAEPQNPPLCLYQGTGLPSLSSPLGPALVTPAPAAPRNRVISNRSRRTSDVAPRSRPSGKSCSAVAGDFAPILISLSRRLVSDHASAVLGSASVRMKLSRL
jgi:hypothetical protein